MPIACHEMKHRDKRYYLKLSAGLGLATGGAHGCHGGGHVIVFRLELVGRPGQPGQGSRLGQRLELGSAHAACSKTAQMISCIVIPASLKELQQRAFPGICCESKAVDLEVKQLKCIVSRWSTCYRIYRAH